MKLTYAEEHQRLTEEQLRVNDVEAAKQIVGLKKRIVKLIN